jgi:anti-anti-sigma factor
MLNLHIEKIGHVAIIHCEGRIVRSDAAFQLRDAVTHQADARVVLLDLSDLETLEGGGLGMLRFLGLWCRDHGIQLKLFDPPDRVRRSLASAGPAAEFEIARTEELLSLLGWEGRRDTGTAVRENRDLPSLH